jgi:hypothetical protein
MAQPRLRHSEKFRTYQRQAIEMVRRYRKNYSDLPNVEHPTSGATLVCHPTGPGKTVVIAGLAHASPEIGNVLVLTTREAVRDQLSRELAGDLFIDASKFGLGINIRLAKVVYVVEEGRALLGEVGDLHGSSYKPYGADLRASPVDDVASAFGRRFPRAASVSRPQPSPDRRATSRYRQK